MIVQVEVLLIITIYSTVKPLPMGTLGSEEISHCREMAAMERQECNIHVTLVCFGGATLIFLKNAYCSIQIHVQLMQSKYTNVHCI